MVTSSVQTFEWGAISPSFFGEVYYRESQSVEGSWVQNLGARALYIAQAIVSFVTLPLNFIAMIFGSALALCFEGSEAAWAILDKTSRFGIVHLALIPTGLIGAFAPESAMDMKRGLINWV